MFKEFSKIIVIVTTIMGWLWVSASYILAFFGHDPNIEVTKIIIAQVVMANCSYYGYQGWLKNSTNKYGTDKDGIPYEKTKGDV